MTAPFDVAVERDGDTITVVLDGELDVTTAGAVEAALPPMTEGGRCVIDLRGLSFMDSTAIHLFMRLDLQSRREGWTLALVRGTGVVAQLLEVCHLDERIAIIDDAAPAV
jgi:anti-anti-sigma factor